MSVKQSIRPAAPSVRPARERRAAGAAEVAEVAALFAAHGTSCDALARSVLRDENFAHDAVQEAFPEHWRNAAFDATRSVPRSWLLMLTHRRAVDQVRHEQLRTFSPLSAAPDQESSGRGPEDLAMAAVLAPKVREALGTLPPVQQEALALAYWGRYTQLEVAKMTQTPLGTVKVLTRAGMISQREALEDEHDEVREPDASRASHTASVGGPRTSGRHPSAAPSSRSKQQGTHVP